MTNAVQHSPRTRAENKRIAVAAVRNLHPDDIPEVLTVLCQKFGIIRVEHHLRSEKERP